MGIATVVVLLTLAGCSDVPSASPEATQEVGADCGAMPLPATASAVSPSSRAARQRVEAFIRDYHRAWERAGQPGGSFDAWNAELAKLAATHLVDDTGFALDEGGLSRPAHHDPEHETIQDVAVDGDVAQVRTRVGGISPSYYTYRVVRAGSGWRIERTTLTLDPPDAPLMASAAHADLLERVPTGTRLQGSPTEARHDLDDLFRAPFTLRELAPIATSGVMAVHDFGWVSYDLAPLAQRVPAGTYPVEVSQRGDGTNVALRVDIADQPTARWVKAARIGSDNLVSVDAGNVAVLDFTTMPACRNQRIEELYDEHLSATGGDVFSIAGGPDDAIMVQAGYGDGVYPTYWGVAHDGTITALVVDFLVDPG
jgi:hypothetical protein